MLLTGGGTGGHVNPALAIAEGIKKRQPNTRFLYVGVRGKAEAIIVERAGYRLYFVPAVGYPGLRPSWRLLRFVFCLLMGTAKSLGILFQFTPSLIVATGGYVSAPMVLAGLILRSLRIAPIRIFVHEQNSIPGQLNAFIGRWADRVLLTFPQTLHLFSRNGVVVGYPVRHSIALKPRMEALSNLSLDIPPERKIVFVFGGSQGSRTINRGIVDALRYMLPHRDHLFIIHGMGLAKSADYDCLADTEKRLQSSFTAEELELLQAFYFRQDYFHNIADVYSISDLIVCRSGAGSLNEISRLQKPALLIPKANLPGDHQVMNARALKHAGAAEILFEDTAIENGLVLEKVEGNVLSERILRLVHDPDRLAEMGHRSGVFFRRHATQLILNELYGDGSYTDDVSFENAPLRPLLSNNRLLAVLDGAYRRYRQDFDPLKVIGDQDDLVYYQYRAAALLTHGPWQDRNVGVKLMGLTQYREKTPALLHMLADRTPASWSNRLFGGDFEQVGFIRRNIVRSLQVINCFNADIEKHLLAALEDPYFEVRAVGPAGREPLAAPVLGPGHRAPGWQDCGKLRAAGEPHGLVLVDGQERGSTHALWRRFLRAFGSPNHVGHGATGNGAMAQAMVELTGTAGLPGYDFENARLVLLLGTGALESSPQTMALARAVARGSRPRFVCAWPRLLPEPAAS